MNHIQKPNLIKLIDVHDLNLGNLGNRIKSECFGLVYVFHIAIDYWGNLL